MNPLSKIIHDVQIGINESIIHYEVWWALGSASKEKYRKTFSHSEYALFIEASLIAHQMAMLMALGRLFDTDSRASSMKSLKTELENNGNTEMLSIIKDTMAPYNNLVKKIINIRCSIIAHTQTNSTDNDVLIRNGITPSEIKNLIDSATKVIGKIAFKLNHPIKSHCRSFYGTSAKKVLDKLNV